MKCLNTLLTANTSTHQVTPTISPSPPLGKSILKLNWQSAGCGVEESEITFPQAGREGTGRLAGALVAARFPRPRFRRKRENAQTRTAERLVKANTDSSQGSNCCVMTASFDEDRGTRRTPRVRPQTAQVRRSWSSPPSPPRTWAPRVRFEEKFGSKQVLKWVLAPRYLPRDSWSRTRAAEPGGWSSRWERRPRRGAP